MIINKKLLKDLESEAISIIRDSFSKSMNAVLMYSIGKDSSVLLHLARKAFYPSTIPFPLCINMQKRERNRRGIKSFSC